MHTAVDSAAASDGPDETEHVCMVDQGSGMHTQCHVHRIMHVHGRSSNKHDHLSKIQLELRPAKAEPTPRETPHAGTAPVCRVYGFSVCGGTLSAHFFSTFSERGMWVG